MLEFDLTLRTTSYTDDTLPSWKMSYVMYKVDLMPLPFPYVADRIPSTVTTAQFTRINVTAFTMFVYVPVFSALEARPVSGTVERCWAGGALHEQRTSAKRPGETPRYIEERPLARNGQAGALPGVV